MLQGIGNLLGSEQPGLYGTQTQSPLNLFGQQQNTNPLGGLGGGLSGLLSNGLKSTQNEQRLMQEKQQRNLLKKYLTQQTGDPIQASLISNTIPGKGALDDFDVGLGTKSNILKSLGLGNNSNLSTIGSNPNLLNSLVSNNNSIAGNSSNAGLLSSLVSLASTPNNNGNILSSLGGLGTGLLGNASNTGSGLLGSIQSGINTLNTVNKISNTVNSVKGLFA